MARKSKASSFVSALGALMAIIQLLMELVTSHGGSDEDVYRLATPEGKSLLDEFAKKLVAAGKSIYKVSVDYRKSWGQMIADAGFNPGDVHESVYKLCYLDPKRKGVVDSTIEFVRFNCDNPVQAGLCELALKENVPALPEEVIAAAALDPSIGAGSVIVVLATFDPAPQGLAHPSFQFLLYVDGGRRQLSHDYGVIARRKHYYIAVRKRQPSPQA